MRDNPTYMRRSKQRTCLYIYGYRTTVVLYSTVPVPPYCTSYVHRYSTVALGTSSEKSDVNAFKQANLSPLHSWEGCLQDRETNILSTTTKHPCSTSIHEVSTLSRISETMQKRVFIFAAVFVLASYSSVYAFRSTPFLTPARTHYVSVSAQRQEDNSMVAAAFVATVLGFNVYSAGAVPLSSFGA